MCLAGLRRKYVTMFSNIHFICALNLVDSVTLGKEIATDLKSMYCNCLYPGKEEMIAHQNLNV
jgi:hypothetical protein